MLVFDTKYCALCFNGLMHFSIWSLFDGLQTFHHTGGESLLYEGYAKDPLGTFRFYILSSRRRSSSLRSVWTICPSIEQYKNGYNSKIEFSLIFSFLDYKTFCVTFKSLLRQKRGSIKCKNGERVQDREKMNGISENGCKFFVSLLATKGRTKVVNSLKVDRFSKSILFFTV